MSYSNYLSGHNDQYSDIIHRSRNKNTMHSTRLPIRSSYMDVSLHSIHKHELKVVDSIDHDLKREYELDMKRNFERDRNDFDDERDHGPGRGYLHEREDLERERRVEIEHDRRIGNTDFQDVVALRNHCRKLVISNLPYSVNWRELKEFMKKAGDVLFADILIDAEGKSKGVGIVEYASFAGAELAMQQLDSAEFCGRNISVREDRYPEVSEQLKKNALGAKRTSNSSYPLNRSEPSCTIYVGNLDYEINWQKLKDVFRAAGFVKRADIYSDKDGKSKGFGNIEFAIPRDALNAIDIFDGYMLNNRPMVVRLDKANSLQIDPRKVTNFLERDYVSSAKNRNTELRTYIDSDRNRWREERLSHGRVVDDNVLRGESKRLSSTRESPYDYFRELRKEVYPERLINIPKRVDFAYKGSDLLDLPKTKRPRFGFMAPSLSPREVFRDRGEQDYSKILNRSSSSNSRKVFIRNLPYSVSWQEMKDLFRSGGLSPINAEINKDSEGKSRGFGVVTFDTNFDAQRAIDKFNGYDLHGRKIEIRFDKYD